ncbi:MAG: cob(I)yrinic acid a,c-diamide adenosyltransferase, partial [Polymorphobacter sp.]
MVKLNKIYTRTGDDGSTGLVDGSRRPKYEARIAAYGTTDEANSVLGIVRLHTAGTEGATAADAQIDAMLARIQNDLFDVGADLATPGDDFTPSPMALRAVQAQIDRLETEIDAMNANLAPLTSFILPGGTPAAAYLHLARTVVRRAERLAVEAAAHEPVNPLAVTYLNRLSD